MHGQNTYCTCACVQSHTHAQTNTHAGTDVLTYIIPGAVLTSGHWAVFYINYSQEDLLSMLRKLPLNIVQIKPRGHLSTSNEYLCFQKITKLEYMYPDGFPENAKNLVSKILVS